MISTEFANGLDPERVKDDIDAQFIKVWPLVHDAAIHDALRDRDRSVANLAATVFKAYYRSVYLRRGSLGSIVFVYNSTEVLFWLRRYIAAFLAMRDVSLVEYRASSICPALRSTKEAAPYSACSLFYGLPFPSMMSWDITNLLSICNPAESLFFAETHPASWEVRATQAGEVVRLEDRVEEVFDLLKEISNLRKVR